MIRRVVAAAVIGVALLASPPSAGVNPLYSTAVTIVAEGPVRTLDPVRAASHTETDLIRALFEGLVREGPGGPEAAGAERWTVSSDRLTWTFHLNPAARFTNGAPVTAAAFVESWQRLRASRWAWILDGATAEAAGAQTLVVRLTAPVDDLLERLALPAASAVFPVGEGRSASLLGSGPFRFGGVQDGSFVLAPRPDHHRGRPFAARLTFSMRLPAGGSPDVALSPPAPAGTRPGPDSHWWLVPGPSLGDAEARRLLAGAIDRGAILPALSGGGRWRAVSRFAEDGAVRPAGSTPPAPPGGLSGSFRLLIDDRDAAGGEIGVALSAALATAGIHVTVVPTPAADLEAALAAGNFDLAVLRWDPIAPRTMAAHEILSQPGVASVAGGASLARIQDDHRLIPLVTLERTRAVRPNVRGLRDDVDYLSLEDVWIGPGD